MGFYIQPLSAEMAESLQLRGTLVGHNGWVTQIVTNRHFPDMILSSSRDKSLILWKLTREENNYGIPQKRLRGHSHFISDVVLSLDGHFALSGSWDKTLRLWDLAAGKTTRRFEDHTKDVLSVAFSADNRQIVSGSRDKTIKLWNTLAQCKYTIQEDGHSDWVSCVRFSPSNNSPIIVSCGWDKAVKVWSLTNCKLKTNHYGHTGYLNTVTVSPDGSLYASVPIATGFAPLPDLQSRSGILRVRTWLMNSSLMSSPQPPRQNHLSVSPWPGLLMGKHFSLDTLIIRFVSGKSALLLVHKLNVLGINNLAE